MVRKATSNDKSACFPQAGTDITLRKIRKGAKSKTTKQLIKIDCSELICTKHENRPLEFLCTNSECLNELCSLCLLTHKAHIEEVFPLGELVQRNVEECQHKKFEELQEDLQKSQTAAFKELDVFSEKIKDALSVTIDKMKEQLIREDDKISKYLETYSNIRSKFLHLQTNVNRMDGPSLKSLKEMMRSQRSMNFNSFVIEDNLAKRQFTQMLANNITLVTQGCNPNSTDKDVPKYLHWFEWEKRDLHLFNVVTYSHRVQKLGIFFKIPPFSRSVVIPDGRIFLLGGEDSESGPKKEVYSFNLNSLSTDNSLHPRACMLHKKYDFAVCHHAGFIYVISGKGHNSDIVDTCDRYDVTKDCWTPIARVNKKRYAASAVVVSELDKIYLFGGRSDHNNQMAEEIEEYNIASNTWSIVKLRNPQDFVPVEVCSAVQISPGKIIVFGGSDSSIHDTSMTYVFNCSDSRVERVGSLKKAHVFVTTPFVYGCFVFAIGNEYYVKNRNIHRFNILTYEWDLIY